MIEWLQLAFVFLDIPQIHRYSNVLERSFSNLHDCEWIVVDDCYDDDSFSYIKSLTKDDSRISVLITVG